MALIQMYFRLSILLTIAFVILKGIGVATFSWWVVWSPIFLANAVFVAWAFIEAFRRYWKDGEK